MATPESSRGHVILDSKPYVLLEKFLFDLRFVLVVGYLTVGVGLIGYVTHTAIEVWKFISTEVFYGDTAQLTITMLSRLDELMVANVAYLILAGSYDVYVTDRVHDVTFRTQSERPRALRHLTSGVLKEKMAASLIGVSSVYLLTILIEVGTKQGSISMQSFIIKVSIHLLLILGFLAFYIANRNEDTSEPSNPQPTEVTDESTSGSDSSDLARPRA